MSYPHYTGDDEDWGELGGRRCARFYGPKPEIVVLCGSTKFFQTFRDQNLRLTLEGKIVLSIGCDTKSDHDMESAAAVADHKVKLDQLHKRKIDLANRVLVLNVDNYIGDSTASEVAYAMFHSASIDWLETPTEEEWGKVKQAWKVLFPKCPRCQSPDQDRHPAMQYEGEVQICPHPWHLGRRTTDGA